MTRLMLLRSSLVVLCSAATAWGQSYPTTGQGPKYAPPAGPRIAGPQPPPGAQPQPTNSAQPALPQRASPPPGPATYPTRQASGQQPVQQPIGPPAGVAPGAPQQPEWAARMTVEELKRVDQLLAYWESRSNKIRLFECKFQQWDYEGGSPEIDVQGRTVKIHPRTYAEGIIKYAQPDKGLYHVKRLAVASVLHPGEPPQHIDQNPELGEHWVCDGVQIYSFEANKKQVTVSPLPPGMRGQAIADGPLPFMFGAKAETIKARYWVHELKPTQNGTYLLEAVPKSRQDAQNFKAVQIVLDEKEYLPDSLIVFSPNYDPPKNDARKTYVFTERNVKDADALAEMVKRGLDPLRIWNREFYEVRIPTGWKKVVENGPGGAPLPPQQAAPPQRQLQPITR
jgi:TIGR03009 family protein